MKKGVFWVVRGDANTKLISVSVCCDKDGNPLEDVPMSSKSGTNFNHKQEWSLLDILEHREAKGKPFDYYPRGRVEIKSGKVTIFLNPDINTESVIGLVKKQFELGDDPEIKSITVKSDGSRHYKYSEGN